MRVHRTLRRLVAACLPAIHAHRFAALEMDPRSEAIESTADAERAGGADNRRPEVQRRVAHAIEIQILEERLGNESQALRPSGKRPDHCQSGQAKNDGILPAVRRRCHGVGGTSDEW